MKKNRNAGKNNNYQGLTHPRSRLLIAFLLGLACGYGVLKYISGEQASSMIETRQGGYEFISPLLECDLPQDTVEGKELLSLKQKIRALIDEKKKQPAISHVSLYFRDLNNGPWIGVDERASFSPASLLKVPFMMAVLKEAETNPALLGRKLTYNGPVDLNTGENFKPAKAIKPGRSYTIADLIHYSVVYSDNNAYILLLRNFPQNKLVKVYSELGVDPPYDIKGEDFMTVREYASFFRILFNASYLNRETSTKALRFLSGVDYKSGIVAGVPSPVRVVHKFGERSLGPKLETKQLHDCGIVYYPNHPYLLCIMTRGTSFEPLTDTIAGISQLIYKELDGLYKEKT